MARKKYKLPGFGSGRTPTIKSEVLYTGPKEGMSHYFERFSTIFDQIAKITATAATKKVASDIVKDAKKVLDDQTYNWKPLKAYYKAWKIRQGLDERILIATGFYRDNIGWWVSRGNVQFGVRQSKKTTNGLPLWKLARIHEFGTRTIPARPLWRPLISKHIRNNESFAEIYRKALEDGLKSNKLRQIARRMLV